MRQILTVDHGNRERAAGAGQHSMILGNHCDAAAPIDQDHGDCAADRPVIAGVPRVRQRISAACGSFAPFPGSDGGPPPGGPVPATLGAAGPPRQSSLWTGLWVSWGHPGAPLWI